MSLKTTKWPYPQNKITVLTEFQDQVLEQISWKILIN